MKHLPSLLTYKAGSLAHLSKPKSDSNSVPLFKPLSNVSGLETLDLTLGASLDLKNPFGRQRPTTSRQLTELEYTVLA